MTALMKSFIRPPTVTTGLPALAMADASHLPRSGFKGSGTPDWLGKQGLTLPSAPNRWLKDRQGRILARLSQGEFLLLGDFKELDAAWSYESAPMCFPLLRQHSHAWILISGDAAPKLMAKICGVDLRPGYFAEDEIAQTSVARLNAIVIADRIAGRTGYHLLADIASSQYLWDCLADAMLEFQGAPVDAQALLKEEHGKDAPQG